MAWREPPLALGYALTAHRIAQGQRERKGRKFCLRAGNPVRQRKCCPAVRKTERGLAHRRRAATTALWACLVGEQRFHRPLNSSAALTGCLLSVAWLARAALSQSSAPIYPAALLRTIPEVAYPWRDAERVMGWPVPRLLLLLRRTGEATCLESRCSRTTFAACWPLLRSWLRSEASWLGDCARVVSVCPPQPASREAREAFQLAVLITPQLRCLMSIPTPLWIAPPI